MAVQVNKVFLIGNLTRDTELRYTPAGVPVANLGIAVNKNYTTPSGEKKEKVTFLNIVAWRKLAEFCGNYLKKGRRIFVEGALQSRSWTTPEGAKRTAVEIVADSIQALDRSPDAPQHSAGETEFSGAPPADEDAPAPEDYSSKDESPKDDLPF
jgi:single-strand DNA-binding protein